MATKTITERVSAPFAGSRVDREKGVISGVLICGAESANGRDYPPGAFGDGTQYEGRHVYADHSRDRRVADKVGWFEGVRFRGNGLPEGDFHVLKSHPLAAQLLEAAERNPRLFGFSHVARCRTSVGAGGRERVEAIEEVESIDIVAEPATTKGLFESSHRRGNPMLTVKKLCERVMRSRRASAEHRRAAKRLLNLTREADVDDAAIDDDDLGGEPLTDAEPDRALTAGFASACKKLIDDALAGLIEPKEALQQIQKLLAAHDELNGTDATAGEEEEAAAESRRRRAGSRVVEWDDTPRGERTLEWDDDAGGRRPLKDKWII